MRRLPLSIVISGLGLTFPVAASAAQPALPAEDPGAQAAPPSLPPDPTMAPPMEPAEPAAVPVDPAADVPPPDPAGAGILDADAEGDLGGELSLDADTEGAAVDGAMTGPGTVRGRHEPMMPTNRGAIGLFHTTLPDVGGDLSFRFRIHTDFFRKSGFIYDNSDPAFGADEHARVRGGVNLGFTPWKYIELFFSINSQANRNSRTQPAATPRQDAETIFALGDLDFGAKGAYEFKDGGIGLGADFGLGLLSGTERLSTQGVNFWFDVLFAVDLRHLTKKHVPVRLSTNIGWMLDNSRKLVDWDQITDPTSREVTRFALGVNHDRVRMRYAVDFPIRLGKEKQYGIDPILEWSWDVSTEKDDRFAQAGAADSPLKRTMQWLTLGARGNVVSGLHIDAAIDVGVVSPNFEYGPPVPPWQLILGLGWSLDAKPQIREVEVAPEVAPEDLGPPPAVEGRVVGQVLNADGSPIPGAKLLFPGMTTNAILADEQGNFTTFRFPAGTVAVQVEADGQIIWEGSAEVADGEDTNLTIQLEGAAAPATGILQGAFVDAAGQPVVTSMHVTGQGVDEAFSSTDTGLIALELFEGVYSATLSAPGFADKVIEFTVPASGEISIQETMEPAAPVSFNNVSGNKSRIRLRKGIRYTGETVNSSSNAILDELVAFMKAHPEYAVIEIGVHTDDRGNPKKRSTGRAEAVRTHLVSRGIAPTRVVAKGYADAKPIAVNMTPDGRKKNNRTEIKVKTYNK